VVGSSSSYQVGMGIWAETTHSLCTVLYVMIVVVVVVVAGLRP